MRGCSGGARCRRAEAQVFLTGAALLLLLGAGGAGAADAPLADDHWHAGFCTDPFTNTVNAVAVNSNTGDVYAGGTFSAAGNVVVNCIAKWNGTSWSALGTGMNSNVYALAMEGSGNLYAGGQFSGPGGKYIAKWNGTSWSALGTGMNNNVYAITIDGSGNLYAGGSFTTAGGVTVNRIAKWNGTSWSALGTGMDNTVLALTADGSGNLYAGGLFTTAGGVTVNRIAKWDGTSWSALGAGMNNNVYALTMGGSANLYAGGYFTTAGGVSANYVAKWNGTGWSAVGAGTAGTVNALTVDGNGNVYAGGSFTFAGGVSARYTAKWDGTSWSSLGAGMNDSVNALTLDGNGNPYAGGNFTTAGGTSTSYIAKWNGVVWSCMANGTIGNGLSGGQTKALAGEGSGNVYAGGDFRMAGGVSANCVAKWNGTSWSGLGTGMGGYRPYVGALALDGSGNLYAGGYFTTAGGISANHIAKWNGTSWSALGTGIDGSGSYVESLAVDGSGNVYVGGTFTAAGGVSANYIAKWDGTSWSALGTGMNNGVVALALDGSGNLYAGGTFTTAGGVSANYIAKWNGSSWSALGTGMGYYVVALALDGSGDLYAGGWFTTAGGIGANYIAKWKGTGWLALGTGTNGQVTAVAVDGSGNLYAGGGFTTAGGVSANRIAKWNGTSWLALGSGTNKASAVNALALRGSTDLYAGGTFELAGGKASAYFAHFSNQLPVNTAPPSVTGTYAVGQTLTANPGTWADADGDVLTHAYQWQRANDSSGTGAADISGATNSTYVLVTADVGTYVRVTVTANDGASGTASVFSVWAAHPPPTVTGISPAHGPATLATAVTILGSNFAGTPGVTFGGIPASGVSATATRVNCIAPTHAAGGVNVVVTNPDGQTSSGSYTYDPAPTVTSFTPYWGRTVGGLTVTISGTGFATSGTVTVTFQGVAASGVSVPTTTRLTCVTPAGMYGNQTIVVTNPDGQSATAPSVFTVWGLPTLSSVAPAAGTMQGGTAVTLTGYRWVGLPTVRLGPNSATSVVNVNSSTLTCVTPAGTGTVEVTATDSDGYGYTKSGAFTYFGPAPSISGITPTHGRATVATAVTISGSNFVETPTVTFAGHAATNVTATATRITCTAPTGSGSVSVVVTNPDGQTASTSYTYDPAPIISDIAPTHGPATVATPVTIGGTGFAAGATVAFGGSPATGLSVASTQITCTAPTHAAGTVDVVVANPDGQTAAGSFEYRPTVPGCDYTAVYPGALTLQPAQSGSLVIYLDSPAQQEGVCSFTLVYDAAQIAFTSALVDGADANGNDSAWSSVSVPGQLGLEVYNFSASPFGPLVTSAGARKVLLQVSFQATSNATAGTYALWVSGDVDPLVMAAQDLTELSADTIWSGTGTLTIVAPPPTLSGISPAGYSASGGGSATLTGSGFSTAGTPSVTFDGLAATVVSVQSGTLVCVIPSRANPFPTLKLSVSVSVMNPDAQSASCAFQYFADIEGNVYPRSTLGSGARPNVLDVGLIRTFVTRAALPRRGMEFQKADCYPVGSGDGATNVLDVGAVRSCVSGSALRAAAGYTYFGPTLASIVPSTGPSFATVTITGTNFETTATVTFGGVGAASLTVVSSTRLLVTTPAHAPGAVDVVVTNSEGLKATAPGGYRYGSIGSGDSGASLTAPGSTESAAEPQESPRLMPVEEATLIPGKPSP